MSIFRKYKTFEDIMPGFLLEKEIGIQHKSFAPYENHARVFLDCKLLIINSKIFSELHDICTSLDWIVGGNCPAIRVNRTPFQSFLSSVLFKIRFQ